MAHLTAVSHSVAELRQVIGAYAAAGIPNILAVRGDPPGDPLGEWLAHPEGLDLRRGARRGWSRRSATSASASRRSRTATRVRPISDSDLRYLLAKIRAGADFAISQLFLEPEGVPAAARPARRGGLRRPAAARDHAAHHGAHPAPRTGAVRCAAARRTSWSGWRRSRRRREGVPRRGHGRDGPTVRAAARRGRARAALLHAEPLACDGRAGRPARARRAPPVGVSGRAG